MKEPYLLAKALAYAIVAIESRPETIREQADYHDMVLLFRKLPASEREMFLDEARRDLVNHSTRDAPSGLSFISLANKADKLAHGLATGEALQPKFTKYGAPRH